MCCTTSTVSTNIRGSYGHVLLLIADSIEAEETVADPRYKYHFYGKLSAWTLDFYGKPTHTQVTHNADREGPSGVLGLATAT